MVLQAKWSTVRAAFINTPEGNGLPETDRRRTTNLEAGRRQAYVRSCGGAFSPPDTLDTPTMAVSRILVVDDDRDTADSMATLLRMLGHDITVAYTGMDALREVDKCDPHVVLLDIGMPSMNGYEVAKRLRKQMPDVVIVALSGYGQRKNKVHARDVGIDHYLVKPVELSKLQSLLACSATLKLDRFSADATNADATKQ